MKTVLHTILLVVLSAASLSMAAAEELAAKKSAEPAKVKVAVVNIQRIVNNGNFYDKLRVLSLGKSTLEALKKINAEIQEIQKQLVDADDQTTLNDLNQKLQFLIQKSNMLRQTAMNSNPNIDMQAALRNFTISQFKDKYALILQQQDMGNNVERVLWKGDIEIVDISDEVQEKFREYLDKVATGDAAILPNIVSGPANGAIFTAPRNRSRVTHNTTRK